MCRRKRPSRFAARARGGYPEEVDGWRLLRSDAATNLTSSALASLLSTKARPGGFRPLLCISDILGDLTALESILGAVKHLNLQGIVACGNHCAGGAEPFEVWGRLHSLGAHLTCGPTDTAIGNLDRLLARTTPRSEDDEARLRQLIETHRSLGDVVSRRLGELPTTLVVSLDDRSGVMALHGSPVDDSDILIDDEYLPHKVACVAEDVLVTGAGHHPFARRAPRDEDILIVEDQDDDGLESHHDGDPLANASSAGDKSRDKGRDKSRDKSRDQSRDDDRDDHASPPLLVVNVGSVAENETKTPEGRRTAHAVLIALDEEGQLQAFARHVPIGRKARARRAG